MPELTTDFQSLPEEYQHIIRLAQDQHEITVAPLQLLVSDVHSDCIVSFMGCQAPNDKRVKLGANVH